MEGLIIYNKNKIPPYVVNKAKEIINQLTTEKKWSIQCAKIDFSYRVNMEDIFTLELIVNRKELTYNYRNDISRCNSVHIRDIDTVVIEVSLAYDKISQLMEEVAELKREIQLREEKLNQLEKRMEEFENKIKK
jgi:uncharacterized coiled-coil protein SlyX